MKKQIKQLFLGCVLLLVGLILVSCDATNTNPNAGKEYTITYYSDNEIIPEVTPATYIAGKVVTLPVGERANYTFIGWYTNPGFTGESVEKILATDYGDKTFYAKWQAGENPNPIVRTITWDVDGGIMPTNYPTSYTEGTAIAVLPVPTKAGFVFEGWYLNNAKITSIPSTMKNDIELVAKWTSTAAQGDLDKAVANMTNYTYKYTYSATDGLDDYESNCVYENNKLQSVVFDSYWGENITEYLATINGVEYYYGEYDDGTYYYVDETRAEYKAAIVYIDVIDISGIANGDYTFSEGLYKYNKTTIDAAARLIFGDFEDEEFTSLEIKVANNVITNIYASSTYTQGTDVYYYNYELLFTKVGTSTVTLPDAEELEDTTETLTISEVLASSDETIVTTTGYVAGLIGNNVYIADGVANIYVYYGDTNDYISQMTIGKSITVTGTKTTYKGVVEITTITNTIIGSGEQTITPKTLSDLSNNTLEANMNTNVTFTNATIVSLPSSWTLSNKDHSLTISDGTNKITYFISKHLAESQKTILFDFLKTLKVGDKITITNGTVSYYNAYQITTTNLTTLSSGYNAGDPVVPVKITAPAQVNVEQNATWADVLAKVTINVVNNDSSTLKIDNSDCDFSNNYDGANVGTYQITVNYGTFSTTFNVVVKLPSGAAFKPAEGSVDLLEDVIKTMGKDTDGTVYGVNRGLSSTGNPKILVIPIDFSDYAAPTNMVENINKAFFGTSTETGWESLASYYNKASYGKLNITGTVLPVYSTGKSTTYFDSFDEGDYEIIKSALEYYDATINYADYDTDGDGYIDSLCFIYASPYSEDEQSMWWAYTYEYYTDDYEYYDEVETDFYYLASYHFMFEELSSKADVNYNAETFIHECGHLLGLDDYYDTDTTVGPAGGIGGGDMMDGNVGDMNPFSKTILGWTTPTVFNGQSDTITLRSFGQSGDCVIIPKSWNGSYFDEYYIIDFYTPDGVNEIEAGYSGLFSTSGIRIFHVDATLKDPANVWSVWDIYEYNNSLTAHKLIELIEADGRNDIVGTGEYGGWSEDSDLFQKGTSFTNIKWYDGTNAGFTISVTNITETEAVISIQYN